MLSVNDFLDLNEEEKNPEKIVKFGKVDAAHTTGRPRIVFDGTDTPSTKKYPFIATYTPTANDRVMILKNVVIGKIV